MTTQPQPAQQQPPKQLHWWNDKELILRGLAQSNYITAWWDWFMMLLGKAAEPVLFASVLYSGYELLPSVPQPGAVIDAPMFITQQAALDIGGLGLMKMAKRAKLPKDSFPYCVGIILVVLMIVNVAMASLEKVVHLPPFIATGVEGFLLIARAVMAVLYGHAIHALKDEGVTLAHGQSRMQEQVQQVQAHLEELAQGMQQQVQQLAASFASVQANMQQRLQESATLQESRLHLQLAGELAPLQEQLALLPHLQKEHQTLSAHLQTAHLHIADLTAQLEQATCSIADLQTAHLQSAKQEPAPPAKNRPAKQAEQQNITSIDEARARHEASGQGRAKVSHADVLAFLAANPDLKRVEVAERLGVSERKVYDAIAWGKEQGHEAATAQ